MDSLDVQWCNSEDLKGVLIWRADSGLQVLSDV